METIQINLRIEKEKLEKLKQLARILSVKQKKDICYTDLVRDGIDMILKDNFE